MIDAAIIGGGAAGFFAAAQLISKLPEARVLILEKTGKTLSKVKISGGGRCNVCPNILKINELIKHYPRGNPWLIDAFTQFSVSDILKWFEERGVSIVAEPDGRMFPKTNDSHTIISILQKETLGKGVELRLHAGVQSICQSRDGYKLHLEDGQQIETKTVIITTGGHPTARGFHLLSQMGLKIVEPVPSLFTFNVRNHSWSDLMGVSIPKARVMLGSIGLEFEGPVLITHWGFSGPAVLKLSAFAARSLNESGYRYDFSIDWLPILSRNEVVEKFRTYQTENPKRKPDQWPLFELPRRLWERVCRESGLTSHHNWAEVGKKKIQSAVEILKKSTFEGNGKTTFKEEFVTSGGIDLTQINPKTCESFQFPGVFLAGEVLDIDGITGGFNFQAAWSTGYVAASSAAEILKRKAV